MRKLTVAIDGPAGAGKSSVAKVLANRVHYLYIDTGAMYRALPGPSWKKASTFLMKKRSVTSSIPLISAWNRRQTCAASTSDRRK